MKLIQVRPLNPPNRTNESNLSWSKDGAFISFETTRGFSKEIKLVKLDGSYSKTLALIEEKENNFVNESRYKKNARTFNSGLDWSKDGESYSFISNAGTGEYNIYIGSNNKIKKLESYNSLKDGQARWSPTRSEIVFTSARSGKADLYILAIGHEHPTQLTKDKNIHLYPEWGRDGNRIFFSAGTGLSFGVYSIERSSPADEKWSRPKPITNSMDTYLRPRISPDGKLLAFYSKNANDETWNINVIRSNEKHLGRRYLENTLIAKNVVLDLNTGPAWSPDSMKVFYVANNPQDFNPICSYNIYTGRKHVLRTGTKMNHDIIVSNQGIISFRAQVGAWDRVFIALTNQGTTLQSGVPYYFRLSYLNNKERS